MTDYISREAMITAACERCNGEYVPCDKSHCLLMEVIHSIPAADVRSVVYCRDCYAYRRDKELAEAAYLDPKMYCGLLRCEMGEDSFCSYGKRKDGMKTEGKP